jgi:hypothetical protein
VEKLTDFDVTVLRGFAEVDKITPPPLPVIAAPVFITEK